MIENPPILTSILFVLTVLGTVVWSYLAIQSRTYLYLAIGWVILQTIIGLSGFYQDTEMIPPRILLFGVFPTIVMMVVVFLTPQGKAFIDHIDLQTFTYFHTIRIPVEIVLALLYHQGLVSVLMTYEGTNYDLFSGITASLVAYFAFRKSKVNRKLMLGWNVLCLLLLLNVVITAVFSIPSPFQKLAFDQPNIAILYFPFNLLPTFVVPTVLFAHLVAIRQLTSKKWTA